VSENTSKDEIVEVDPRTLLPNPFQVRTLSDSDPRVVARVESIRKNGLLELPVIREVEGGFLQIASGHIRIRALIILNVSKVRCVRRNLSNEQMAVIVLEENLKHESLNPIEEGTGYKNLREKFHWTEEKIAATFGTTRDLVAQRIRLLTFQEPLRQLIASGTLGVSHAEAVVLAPLESQVDLANRVVSEKLTVVQTSAIAKDITARYKTRQQIMNNLDQYISSFNIRLAAVEQRLNNIGGKLNQLEEEGVDVEGIESEVFLARYATATLAATIKGVSASTVDVKMPNFKKRKENQRESN
jgi:ParB family chromosome partitioning protein